MRNFILVVVFIVLAVLAYRAYAGGSFRGFQEMKKTQVQGPVSQRLSSGQRVGQGAGKAFKSVDFGGKR